ncbi:cell division protein FtsW [Microbacterium bovistercoris]|uniref:Probable peptidoglycan glycosyltransferase FtsW n=1 Tax=Microbacterium bovistercoris TaxID=2293570 RepID=A0A371NSP2_9MICO|nr:putative peptidoglycan glycosyltransferase FtsW [Microbacterium bovistercoris]REJ04625.1 cell division protein FtsW [Microbacterium bovistercoris]
MTQTPHPKRADSAASAPARSGLAARVSLGRLFQPVSMEFLLISFSALLVTVFGLVMVLSATSATTKGPLDEVMKQGVFAVIGIPLMFLVSRLPVNVIKRLAWVGLVLGLCLQLLVFTPLGISDMGNRNWIKVAGYTMQPSEFLKLALAIWVAFVLLRKQTRLNTWHQVFIPVVPVSALAIGTVVAGNDLGTAMVMVLIVLGCLFFSGVRLRLFILPLLLGIVAVLGYALTSKNRMNRILAAFNPEDCDISNACYQATHGMWGMASGGVFGVGLGNSQEKYGWLPAAANDYIFAIVGEELGLIGCVLVLGLFTAFAVGAFHIIRKTNDPFIRVAAGGITLWIVGQALFNIGVVIRIFPVMGVPLPFMSQGGTALLSVLLACGVLLAFARTIPASAPVPEAQPKTSQRAARRAPARAGQS